VRAEKDEARKRLRVWAPMVEGPPGPRSSPYGKDVCTDAYARE